MLSRVCEQQKEIATFLRQFFDPRWLIRLALLGKDILVTDMQAHITAFEVKLRLANSQLEHFPRLAAYVPDAVEPDTCISIVASLSEEFASRFTGVRPLAADFKLFTGPFDFPVDDAPATCRWSWLSYSAIGLYRETAIAIESEARDPNGGNVYYVTMQITFHIAECAHKERNLHCDVVHITTVWVSRLSGSCDRSDPGVAIKAYDELKVKVYNSSPLSFFRDIALPSRNFLKYIAHVQRIVAMFGGTYGCEQLFSKMKYTNSPVA